MAKSVRCLAYFLLTLHLLYKCKSEVAFDCTDSDESLDSDESDEKEVYCAKLRSSEETVLENADQSCDTSSVTYSCSNQQHTFTCTSEGRFPDLSDSTCMKYFQCDKLNNGKFQQKDVKCPNSQFCPSTQKCSYNFTCPCNNSSSISSTSSTATTESSTSKATTSPSIIPGCSLSTQKFRCSVQGRFTDLSDASCRRYFLCSKLQNGTFVKTLYRCMKSSFNPLTHRCSASYTCPCSLSQTTSKSAETSLTTSKIPSTTSAVKTEATTTAGTSYTCTSTPNEHVQFTCTEWGRFPDFSDPLCQTYFLCSYLQNGSFVKTDYKCLNSVFDPTTNRCSTKVVCPCSISTSTVPDVTSQKITTASEAATNILGTTTTGGGLITTVSATPGTTTTPATTKTPVETTTSQQTTMASNITTTSAITTTSYTCSSSTNNHGEFECTTVGRFPDFSDSLCQRYFLCSHLQNGSFVRTNYKCLNSVFDPTTNRCSTKVVCPCSISTSTVPGITTTSEKITTASEAATTTLGITTPGGGLTTTVSATPATTTTQATTKTPAETTTSEKTTIASNMTTTSATTTTSYTCSSTTNDHGEFECTTVGRFPDFSDSLCQRYFLCSHLQNGSFVKTNYKCLNSVFDPTTNRCSTKVVCPCSISTSTVPGITTTSEKITTASEGATTTLGITTPGGGLTTTVSATPGTTITQATTKTPVETTTSEQTTIASNITTDTAITTTSYTCLSTTDDHGQFECTTVGRFPDFSDVTCEKYFLCSYLQNGTFIKTKYRCLKSVFDPETKRCSTKIVCPCSLTSSTTETFTRTEELTGTTTSTPTTSFVRYTTTSLGANTTSEVFTTKHTETTTASRLTATTASERFTTAVPSVTTPLYSCSSSNNEYGKFNCTVVGRFADFADPLCEKYFLCSYLQNGTFIKTKYQCLSSVFNPTTKRCSKMYVCPCNDAVSTVSPTPSSTRSSSETSVDETTATKSSGTTSGTSFSTESSTSFGCIVPFREFVCMEEGRFPDPSDVTCRRYFLCSHLRNDSFIKTTYICLNSFFSPLTFRCSLNYKCPCREDPSTILTTPQNSVPTLSEGFTTISAATSERYTTISALITTAREPTSYTCGFSSEEAPEFTCFSTGRFPDYADNACKRYFLCSLLQNGTFVKTPYNCPQSSCIDESTHRCSAECKCPCL